MVRRRVPVLSSLLFFGFVYFSRGTLPPKRRRALLGDLEKVGVIVGFEKVEQPNCPNFPRQSDGPLCTQRAGEQSLSRLDLLLRELQIFCGPCGNANGTSGTWLACSAESSCFLRKRACLWQAHKCIRVHGRCIHAFSCSPIARGSQVWEIRVM